MARPLQYQSQFIPTDFNQVGNLLGMFRQDMAQRNQEFDQAATMEAETLGQIGAMPTADIEGRNRRLQAVEKAMEEAVAKRGGDYRLAVKDLQRIVAQERANPWYQYNQKQMEKMKEYSDLQKRMGVNFYADRDPSQVTLEDYQSDPGSLDFNAYNVGDLKQMAVQKAKEYATANKQFINRGVGNMMREIGWQFGMGDETKAQQYLQQNPQFVDEILSAHNIEDPNVRAMVEQAALTGLVGQRQTRFTPDYEQRYNLEQRQKRLEGMRPRTTGVKGPRVPMVNEGQFSKARDIEKAVISDKDSFVKNAGRNVLDKVVTPDFLSTLDLTPKELAEFENFNGTIYEYINNKRSEFKGGEQDILGTSIANPTAPFPSTMTQRTTRSERKEDKRLRKVKDRVDNAVDMQLALDNSDFSMPIVQVDPWDTKALSALKSATANKSIKDFDILSGDLATLNEKELKGNEDYESLQEGFQVLGGGEETDAGVVFYIKDTNTGKDYLAKAKSPDVTTQLAGIIDSNLAQLDYNHNIKFAGDLMKLPDGREMELPFEVSSEDINGRKAYRIKGLTSEEYWRPYFEAEEAGLREQGVEEEVIEEALSPFAPLLTDEPFKTTDKQDIIDYLNLINE